MAITGMPSQCIPLEHDCDVPLREADVTTQDMYGQGDVIAGDLEEADVPGMDVGGTGKASGGCSVFASSRPSGAGPEGSGTAILALAMLFLVWIRLRVVCGRDA